MSETDLTPSRPQGLAFTPPGNPAEIEEGGIFMPRFDRDGLITCIAIDAGDGRVLMLAHMNADSLARTLETGEAWYWSRSRRQLWRKGATSGQTQRVVEMRTDCDQDALLITVAVGGDGGCCHTGRRACFYRTVSLDQRSGEVRLTLAEPDHDHPSHSGPPAPSSRSGE